MVVDGCSAQGVMTGPTLALIGMCMVETGGGDGVSKRLAWRAAQISRTIAAGLWDMVRGRKEDGEG